MRFLPVIKSYDNSVKLVRFSSYIPISPPSIRGKIKSFSRHSCFRLRSFLQCYSLKSDCKIYGLTLTCPWSSRDQQSFDLDLYRIVWDRWQHWFRRLYPHSGFVFRHELQRRGVPHCHLVVHKSLLDPIFTPQQALVSWSRAVSDFRSFDIRAFMLHGVKLDDLDNAPIRMFRYLADHTSKHKQAQLGYQGKQWGVVGRSNFSEKSSEYVSLSDRQFTIALRLLNRLSRFSIFYGRDSDRHGCFFSCHLSRRRSKTQHSIMFVHPSTQKKIFEFVKNNY